MKRLVARFRLAACASFLALSICNVSPAGVNSFTLTGPEGGAVRAVAFKPDDPNVVVIGGPRGAYRSDNGGLSWQLADGAMLNSPSGVAFDPMNPNRVVITNGQLHLSEDAGGTYALLQGPPTQSSIQKIEFAADGTLYALSLTGNVYRAASPLSSWVSLPRPWPQDFYGSAIASDPQAPQTILVAIDGQGIFRSVDGGNNWSAALTSGMTTPSSIFYYSIAVNPDDSNVVLVGTSDGLYRSNNGGDSWTWQGLGIVSWAGFDPHTPGNISAIGTYGTIMRSENDGASWSLGFNPLVGGMPLAAFDPANPGRLLLGTENGVGDTLDYGATLTYRNTGLRGGSPRALTVSDDGTVYLAMSVGLDGIFRRGTNYTAVGTAHLRGLTNGSLSISALAASDVDPDLLYAANIGIDLLRSNDGGETWTGPHPAFSSGSDYIAGLAVHSGNPEIAYAGRGTSGLWRTTNGGATWQPMPGSTPPLVRVIAFDPADNDVMYISAGTEVTGATSIYKSVDGGDTWNEVRAPGSIWFNKFVFDPENSSTVYAVGVGGVVKSINGGASWTLVDFGPSFGTVVNGTGMYIDAARPSTMVVLGADGGTGFLRTVDGGQTWQQTLIRNPNAVVTPIIIFNGLVVRPQEPNLLIMGAENGGVAEYEIAPDLELSMNGPGNAIALGSVTPLQLAVRNLGIHDASAAEVRITFPAWLTPTTPAGCTYAAPVLTCALSYIRSEQSRIIDFNVTASMTPSNGQVSATVTGHERDPISNNDVASVSLQSLEIADLVTSFGDPVVVFDNHAPVTLEATVRNVGPNPSTDTEVVFELGSQLTAVTLTPTQGNCSVAGTTATCALGTVAVGGNGVRIDISGTANGIGAAAVTAIARGAGVDTNTDQGATANLTLRAVADIGVTVVDSADPVTAGNNWTYTATVSNVGPDAGAANLVVTLTGATPIQAEGPGASCTIAGPVVTCAFAAMANGASVAVAIVASSSVAGNATASASVTFSGTDPMGANDSASASTTKVAPPPPANSGGDGKKGGGGRIDVLLLLGLLGLAAARRVRGRRARILR